MTITIAALYVDERGPYVGLPHVEIWDVTRDARRYPGPHPVVAHPPCERWGSYAAGGPSARFRLVKGDDGGCFSAAIDDVRRWGGILEHPAGSAAWEAHRLTRPPTAGGWVRADKFRGWTCRVDQGQYGHQAQKSTWLYACRISLPELRWERAKLSGRVELMNKSQRHITPIEFRDLLLSIARTTNR